MFDRRKTVNEMYQYSKQEDSMLLSSFGDDNEGYLFWDEYRSKYRRYDKLFNRMFNSFKYFMQNPEQTIAEITEDFTDEVYNHLMINAKKYEELYRIYVINDTNYSITDNYNITETMAKTTSKEDSNVYGSRQDSNSRTIGAKNTSTQDVVGSRQDSNSRTIGAKNTSTEDIVGSRQDSNSRTIGAKNTSTEDLYGQKSVSTNLVKGSQTDSQTNDIAGFNSASYSNDTLQSNVYGQRTDTNTENTAAHTDTKTVAEGQQVIEDANTIGSHTDTTTVNEGQQLITDSATIGSHTDTKTVNEGQQLIDDATTIGSHTDTLSGVGAEDYTLTRKGNIGVRTVTEVLDFHRNFWNTYEFYSYIFKEICAELLAI